MQLLIWSFVFIASVLALVWAADTFSDGAEELGIHLGIPAYVVGVTIVALGTSLPELVSSIVAVSQGSPEIVVGNVVGSNIANIFLILGFSAVIGGRLIVRYEIIHVDLPMLVGSAGLAVFAAWDGSVTLFEGLILLAGALLYVMYAVSISRRREHEEIREEIREEHDIERGKLDPLVWVRLVGGSLLLYLAAEATIRSVVELSALLNVGTALIAASAVALGTSLPELVVSSVAARRGNLDIAMGNILGSSVFNCFAVLGVASLVGTLPVTEQMLSLGLPVMLGATLLYFFMAQDRDISKWEGWLLLLAYVFFLGRLFGVL